MDGGGGERVGERSFACLEAEDTWGIKDVRRSNTLILKGGWVGWVGDKKD